MRDKTPIRMLIVLGIAAAMLLFSSCESEYCENCYTYRYSNGATEYVCVEYICDSYE